MNGLLYYYKGDQDEIKKVLDYHTEKFGFPLRVHCRDDEIDYVRRAVPPNITVASDKLQPYHILIGPIHRPRVYKGERIPYE